MAPALHLRTRDRAEDRDPEGRRAAVLRHPVTRAVFLFLLLTVLAAPLLGVVQHRQHQMSVYDEVSYLDYLSKVDQGHFIVGKGEYVNASTQQVEACRGVKGAVPTFSSVCHGNAPFPKRQLDTADIDPPTYYVITAIGAKVVRAVGITHDLLASARLVGIAWAGLGLTLFVLFARRLGASAVSAVILAAALLFLPVVQTQWTFLTPHAMEVPSAIAVAWTVFNWLEGGGRWWHVALAGFIPPLIKATDVLGVAVGIAALLVGAWWSRPSRPSAQRLLVGAGSMIGGLAVGSGLWLVVRDHYAHLTANEFPQFDVSHFDWHFLTHTFALFLEPTMSNGMLGVALIVAVVTFGLPLSVVGALDRPLALRSLSLATLIGAVFGPWIFVLSNYILLGQYVNLPVRYGLDVVAVAFVLTTALVRGRSAQVLLGALTVALLLIDLVPQYWT